MSQRIILGISQGIFLAILLTGCSRPYLPPDGYLPHVIPPTDSCLTPWPASETPHHLRQTVFLETPGQTHVLQGFMILDLDRAEVRIVGLSELGMKLFDLKVTPEGHDILALAPTLGANGERLADQIALSTRRIFLSHRDMADAEAHLGPEDLLLIDRSQGSPMVQTCDPRKGQVRRVYDPKRRWSVDFDAYQPMNGFTGPGRIVYQDHRAGYALTIVLHEVFEQ